MAFLVSVSGSQNQETIVVNPWEWGDGDRNPYLTTAFQVLDVSPTANTATVRTRAARRRERVGKDAKQFPLFGRVLTVAEVNAAEKQLEAPQTRLAAELLTHRPEPCGDDLADLAELVELLESLAADGEPIARSKLTPPGPDDPPEHDIPLNYRILPALLPGPGE